MKTKLRILITCLTILLLFSCSDDDKTNNDLNSKSPKITREKFHYFKKLPNLISKTKGNINARDNTSNIYEFTIDSSSVTQISYQDKNYFTLAIHRNNNLNNNLFENLVIVEDLTNNSHNAFIIRYFPSDEYMQNLLTTKYPGFKGEISIHNIDYNSIGESFRNEICVTYTQAFCGNNHGPAGPNCYNNSDHGSHIYYKTIEVCSTQNDVPVFVDITDGGGGGFVSGNNGDINLGVGGNTGSISQNTLITEPIIIQNKTEQKFLQSFTTLEQSNWWLFVASDETKDDIINYLNQNTINNVIDTDALVFINDIVLNLLNDNTLSTEDKNKFIELTINAFINQEPWQAISGNYNNIPSLHYTHKRTTYVNGQQCFQYRLDNGDFIAYMNYGQFNDVNMKTFYYSQELRNWYEIPEPTNSNYNHLDLDFIFNGFWSVVATTTRYCTPLEDAIILIDGKDFDGVASSKAAAGIFILVDLVPGGKVFKITKRAGYALSAASPVFRKTVTALYKTQRNLRHQYKLIISSMSSARKGNFGEICTDLDFYEKGYDVLHVNRVNSIDSPIQQGIDHIFKNPQTGEFIIVESKFHGTGGLSTLVDGTRQMSDVWISDGTKTNSDRLWNALNGDLSLYNQIKPSLTINNYTRVIAYVQPDGSINYKYINSNGYEISTPFIN
jgi:hypothetical protein